jgi:hypothetical protein
VTPSDREPWDLNYAAAYIEKCQSHFEDERHDPAPPAHRSQSSQRLHMLQQQVTLLPTVVALQRHEDVKFDIVIIPRGVRRAERKPDRVTEE